MSAQLTAVPEVAKVLLATPSKIDGRRPAWHTTRHSFPVTRTVQPTHVNAKSPSTYSRGYQQFSQARRADVDSGGKMQNESAQPDASQGRPRTIVSSPPASARLSAVVRSPSPGSQVRTLFSSPSTGSPPTSFLPIDAVTRSVSCSSIDAHSKSTAGTNPGDLAEISQDVGVDRTSKTGDVYKILSTLEAQIREVTVKLQANFDRQLISFEKHLMESLRFKNSTWQANFDRRLLAFEQRKQENAEMKAHIASRFSAIEESVALLEENHRNHAKHQAKLESKLAAVEESMASLRENNHGQPELKASLTGRLCAIERSIAPLPELRALILQHSVDQKQEITNVKTSVKKQLLDLEKHIAHISSQAMQDTIHRHKVEQKEHITSLRTLIENSIVAPQDTTGISSTHTQENIQQQKTNQTANTQKSEVNMEQRLCMAEGNVVLIASILKRMETDLLLVNGATDSVSALPTEQITSANSMGSPQPSCESLDVTLSSSAAGTIGSCAPPATSASGGTGSSQLHEIANAQVEQEYNELQLLHERSQQNDMQLSG